MSEGMVRIAAPAASGALSKSICGANSPPYRYLDRVTDCPLQHGGNIELSRFHAAAGWHAGLPDPR